MKTPSYKDRSPNETIRIIKNTLKKLGIQIVEKQYKSDVAGVFSLRVTIKDAPSFGTNGKGTTLIYARASAYAEFIERLANLLLITPNHFELDKAYFDAKKDKISNHINSPFLGIKRNNRLYLRDFCDIYNLGEDNCFSLPFVRIDSKKQTRELLPYPYLVFYGSNGMAAGNSFYEMSVQAISEIFERYALVQILTRKKSPYLYDNNKVLKIFPSLKPTYDSLVKRGYSVKIYDCSIDLDLPVFATIIFDSSKKNYSVSFGGHPNAEFAISRCFTETFQGISGIALKNNVDEKPSKVSDYNLQEIIHNGYGVFPRSFLNVNKPSKHEYLLKKIYRSNKEMFEYYLSLCRRLRFPLYYRDASYLGISAGQYLIPGVSMTFIPDKIHMRFLYTRNKYCSGINNFLSLKHEDKLMLVEIYDFFLNSHQTESAKYVSKYEDSNFINFCLYFALANAICKNYERANRYLSLALYNYGLKDHKPDLRFYQKISRAINSRQQARIERVFKDAEFKRIDEVSPLADRYLPKLLAMQKKYYCHK